MEVLTNEKGTSIEKGVSTLTDENLSLLREIDRLSGYTPQSQQYSGYSEDYYEPAPQQPTIDPLEYCYGSAAYL